MTPLTLVLWALAAVVAAAALFVVLLILKAILDIFV